jgi:hypothetical protein
MLHWGIEHYQYPTVEQREIAQRLLAAGVDLILGHHPHVVQGEERFGHGLVSYSSGNFLFDEFQWKYHSTDGSERSSKLKLSDKNRQGISLQILLDCDGALETLPHFTTICQDATVVIDDSSERIKEYEKLSARLGCFGYSFFWKLYSIRREWDLRLSSLYSPVVLLRKIHKLRLRHFRELFQTVRRSSRISSGKSTNPYE